MYTLADKIIMAREAKNLSQEELGQLVGVSRKSISNYETGNATPHKSTMIKLASALEVSIEYLTDDSCEDPQKNIEQDAYIAETNEQFGASGAKDLQQMLQANTALFAGGELSPEQMDMFYEAITAVYKVCRVEASKKFGKKSSSENE